MQKTVLAATAGLVLAIGIGVAVLAVREAPPDAPSSKWVVNAEGSGIGGPFELTSHQGARVNAAELIDGPTLIYFGYTFCPDVCPIDTQIMVDAVNLLEERGVAVDPVFITVDPARDDVEALGNYAEAFHPRMTALTGTAEDIRAAAEAYKVYYEAQKAEEGQTDYLVNHTAYTYFVLPDGLGAMFRHGTPPEAMATEIERVLSRRGLTG